mgnify:CR=1 FL=1
MKTIELKNEVKDIAKQLIQLDNLGFNETFRGKFFSCETVRSEKTMLKKLVIELKAYITDCDNMKNLNKKMIQICEDRIETITKLQIIEKKLKLK